MDRISNGQPVPENEVLRIETMSAYVSVDPEDNVEGVLAMRGQGDMWLPLVAADHEMILSLRPRAERIARDLGVKVSLVRFSSREVVIEDILEGQHD